MRSCSPHLAGSRAGVRGQRSEAGAVKRTLGTRGTRLISKTRKLKAKDGWPHLRAKLSQSFPASNCHK